MRFVTDRSGEPLILAGNGRGEFYLLEHISQKLNGTSASIYFPYFPSKVLVELPTRRTGLAVLKTLLEDVEDYDLKRFLVVLDLENFTEEIRGKIEEEFESRGVTIAEIAPLNPPLDNAIRVEGRSKSGRGFIVLIAVMGDETCPKTECHIAQVIAEEYGMWIDPNQAKEDFSKKIRQTTGARRYDKLVEDLTEEELTTFFPQLLHALRAVDQLIEP